MKNTGFILFGLAVCAAADVCAQSAQLELGVEDIAGAAVKEEKLDFGQKKQARTKTDKVTSTIGDTLDLFGGEDKSKEKKTVSLEEMKQKAAAGDIEAQLDLGYMYLYGVNGVKADYKQALAYYEQAAEKKNAVALNNLGSLYFNGLGTKVDYPTAIKYFDEAARLGSNDAAVNLAIIYLGSDLQTKSKADFEKIYKLLEQAQTTNNTAKFLLGYAYYKGFLVSPDYKKAFLLIKAAADAQYDEAQYVLSDFYINGWGTPKNYNRAVQYLRMSVAQGNPEAIMRLADILAEGKVYTRNIKNAHVLYNVASVMGMSEAAEKRDDIEKSLRIEDLLAVQSEAENYKPAPSQLTSFIRQTFGNSLKVYIDTNLDSDLATQTVN